MARLTEAEKAQKARAKEIAQRQSRDVKICKAYDTGKHTIRSLAPKFDMSASGIYHVLKRNDRMGAKVAAVTTKATAKVKTSKK